MAQQEKSAGDGATPGSAAQTGTSSLDQAHDVRPAGASSFGDLMVCARRDLAFWEFEGTRAQLEAENVIPPDTVWPVGSTMLSWDSGRFHYTLMRRRPAGLKGPMRLWTSGDWWALMCRHDDGLDWGERAIRLKQRELAEEIRRNSAAGRREFQRYWRAYDDAAFQAFKSIFVPAPAKPGRKAKSAAGGKSHA